MSSSQASSADSGHSGPSEAQWARERSQRASIAALTRWGHADAVSGTASARKAFLTRFHLEADPDGVLPEAERDRRAERLKKAYFRSLAMKSAKARSERKKRQHPSSKGPVNLPIDTTEASQ